VTASFLSSVNWGGALLLLVAAPLGSARGQEPDTADLAKLDIEQLAQIKVTSVARRPEALGQAPAAIFVITSEDIVRSGAISLPEALRLAPGLQVARTGSRDWAISSRGFNERSSNKMLVLVDGREIYSPLFAGVFWDIQGMPLQDIDRIEVILGPGATLWGANAVNGVINVIRRSSTQSRGGLAHLVAGTNTRLDGMLRYGAALTPNVSFRAFGRYLDRRPSDLVTGTDAQDDWEFGHGGFRLDATSGSRDRFMFQGDAYDGTGGESLQLPSPTPPSYSTRFDQDLKAHGASVLGRWNHQLGTGNVALQVYFDHTVRNQEALLGRARIDVLDFDFQHHLRIGARQDMVWGAGYRHIADDLSGAFVIRLDPAERTSHLFTTFLQDDIALTAEQWRLTLGTKLEHNSYSGLEVEPNVRLRWLPSSRQTFWAAVSRAMRTPSRIDVDLDEVGAIRPGTPPLLFRATGNEDFHSEELIAYELGYRTTPHPRLSLDATVYYNDYDRLRTFNAGTPGVEDGFVVIPLSLRNDATGRTYGGTIAASWRPRPWVRLDGNYTYLRMQVKTLPGTFAATSDTRPDFNPQNQAALRSAITLPQNLEADVSLRYVSEIFAVPEYVQGDARLAWSPRPDLMLSVVGKDLFTPRHLEFASPSFIAETRYIPRRVQAQIRWQF
jgi:iron complex outermembrane receptor protein